MERFGIGVVSCAITQFAVCNNSPGTAQAIKGLTIIAGKTLAFYDIVLPEIKKR